MLKTKQEALRYLARLCKSCGDWPCSEEVHELALYMDNYTDKEFVEKANEIARKRGENEQEETVIVSSEEEQGEPTVRFRSSAPPKSY